MSDFSNTAEDTVIDFFFGGTPDAAPLSWVVHLYTTPTDDADGGIEVTGGGYAPAAYAGAWTRANGQASNGAVIDFGTATGPWGTITHCRIKDQLGNNIAHGALQDQTKAPDTDDKVTFPAGTFQFSVD